MWIMSQNKENLFNIDKFQGIEYGTTRNHKHRKGGEPPEDIPTLFLSDGCLEQLGRYETKERCLEILEDIANMYQYANECAVTGVGSTQPEFVYQMPKD